MIAKAKKNTKEQDDYCQKKQKRRCKSKPIASTATYPTTDKVSLKSNCNTAASVHDNNDVAWKCHKCGVLNAISNLRCMTSKCKAYKGRIRYNNRTSTEGCELVWLENGARLGEVHDNSDECYICFTGGSLICCDLCDKSFHLGCHIPPLLEVPFGTFECCECRATTLKKLFHCGECQTCLSGDRDKCPNKWYMPPATATVSPCAKHRTRRSSATATNSSPRTGRRHAVQVQPTMTGDANSFQQNVDTSSKSTQPKKLTFQTI